METTALALPAELPTAKKNAAKLANTRPSTRSMTPPWPGINLLESFTPKRRLMKDSKRSPIWLETDSVKATIPTHRPPPHCFNRVENEMAAVKNRNWEQIQKPQGNGKNCRQI